MFPTRVFQLWGIQCNIYPLQVVFSWKFGMYKAEKKEKDTFEVWRYLDTIEYGCWCSYEYENHILNNILLPLILLLFVMFLAWVDYLILSHPYRVCVVGVLLNRQMILIILSIILISKFYCLLLHLLIILLKPHTWIV